MKTRTKAYPFFGTALEVYSPARNKWFHVRWITGPLSKPQEGTNR